MGTTQKTTRVDSPRLRAPTGGVLRVAWLAVEAHYDERWIAVLGFCSGSVWLSSDGNYLTWLHINKWTPKLHLDSTAALTKTSREDAVEDGAKLWLVRVIQAAKVVILVEENFRQWWNGGREH